MAQTKSEPTHVHDNISRLPWRAGEMCAGKVLLKNDVGRPIGEIGIHHLMALEADANARFICEAVNQHAALIAQRDALREALRSVIKLANEAHREWDADNDMRVGKILIALSGSMPRYRADIDAIHAALALAEGH